MCEARLRPKKFKGHCLRCFIHLFPDEKVATGFRKKEAAVVDFIKEHFPDVDWVCNKQIQGGCSRRRPDLYLDMGAYVLVIEIDENQHVAYNPTCENRRLMELWQDAGGNRPIVVIRFNPDAYQAADGMRVTSCWSYTEERGLPRVAPRKAKEWQARLDALAEAVRRHMQTSPQREVTVEQLFYDKEGEASL